MEQTIYLVMGSKGEYSDRDEWPVAAYTDEAEAQKHVEAAERRAKEIKASLGAEYWRYRTLTREGKAEQNEWDPEMQIDYTGTSYFYYEAPLRREAGVGV